MITANKGPIAHAYAALRDEARAARVQFRFESTVMDGVPIFNMVRDNLPGVKILGFTGALNSTSKVVIEAMRRGESMQDGIEAARRLGITEADASYDIEGWDSAAKGAVLANVLMGARITPAEVDRRGIGRLTPERLRELANSRKTVCLVSRARQGPAGIRVRVRAEVLDETDPLAAVTGTSNLLLLHTDLMGTLGIAGINCGVEQTAYGLFSGHRAHCSNLNKLLKCLLGPAKEWVRRRKPAPLVRHRGAGAFVCQLRVQAGASSAFLGSKKIKPTSTVF